MIGSSLIVKPRVYCVTDFEGGVKVCGDAVLRYFLRGFAEIFILACGISVSLDYAVRGLKKVWVTVIGDREVSAVSFTGIGSRSLL